MTKLIKTSKHSTKFANIGKQDMLYITNNITDDIMFPPQELKIIKLSKPVLIPSLNNVNAENCSTFVGNVLINNGLRMDSNYLNNIFKNGIS